MRKKLNTDQVANELKTGSMFFRKKPPVNKRKNVKVAQKSEQVNEQKVAQNVERLSKATSDTLDVSLKTEVVEELAFRLRKATKSKFNTEIPDEWKKEIDDLAHNLGVGKYDLGMYIIGSFLGKVEREGGNDH